MLDVMLLAAGRGMRLRPLTEVTPKALLPVGAKTLAERHLERLKAQGFRRVVINLAWLGEQIRAQLGDGRRFGLQIRYSDELSGALESGGGIVHALGLLQSDPFIVINCDILSDFDCASLHVSDEYAMHLVMAPNPSHHQRGDFAIAPAGATRGRLTVAAANDAQNCTYSGIACFRRRVFDGLKPGYFPLRPLFHRAIAEQQASAEIYRGQWLDVGSPQRLELARRMVDAESD